MYLQVITRTAPHAIILQHSLDMLEDWEEAVGWPLEKNYYGYTRYEGVYKSIDVNGDIAHLRENDIVVVSKKELQDSDIPTFLLAADLEDQN